MSHTPLRLVFAGTPAFAAAYLAALLEPGNNRHFSVAGVLTQPDRRSGRGKKVTAGPVKSLALDKGLSLLQPDTLNNPEATEWLSEINPDVMIVVAYGLILPQSVLNLPRFGCINVHASLLPRWRGAAPIERAILAGDEETGVSIMQMDAGLDTGPVLARVPTPVKQEDNAQTLTDRLARLGSEALISTLQRLSTVSAPLPAEPQDESKSTYAEKLSRNEAAIDWKSSARQIKRQVQAFYPRSPAFTYMAGERLMIIAAEAESQTHQAGPGMIVSADNSGIVSACASGSLRITRVQPAGKRPMSVADLLNGRRELYQPGAQFYSDPDNP